MVEASKMFDNIETNADIDKAAKQLAKKFINALKFLMHSGILFR